MSKRKLLLADDSITIQKVVSLTFEDRGIEVFTVADGDAAIEKITEIEPDIVLADVHMPGLNGYEVCEFIRDNEATKDLPVLLLVGSFEPFDEERSSKAGANGHVTKPFQAIRALVSQVSELIGLETQFQETVSDIESPKIEKPETDDIETLLEESFAQTVPMDSKAGSQFDDDGLDDAIIETSVDENEGGVRTTGDAAAKRAKDKPADVAVHAAKSADIAIASPFDSLAGDHPRIPVPDLGMPSAESLHQLSTADTVGFDTIPDNASKPEFQLDEIDLLELPKSGGGKPYKFGTASQAASTGSRAQVVSLSPELLEIIVQKVVEKLAEKY